MRHAIVRAASAAAIAIILATASAFAAQATQPAITKAVYKESKGVIIVVGSGFDNTATVRLNGVELTGEKKFVAQKNKLKIAVPAGFAFKATGENRIEIVQNELSSGEFPF